MRTPRFFQDYALAVGTTICVDDNAVAHIARVLRMKTDETITLFNGDGFEYSARLISVEKRRVVANIVSSTNPQRSSKLKVSIGQSISRGERMDFAIQKSTELGMSSLTPLISERTEVKLKADRLLKKQQQWQQIAISACEQSLRNDIPTIQSACRLEQWIKNCDSDVKLLLHHHTKNSLESLEKPNSVALLIGPEGGLTDTEVALALDAGFLPVAFGPRVMRTETAPIAAQAILQYLWGDLH